MKLHDLNFGSLDEMALNLNRESVYTMPNDHFVPKTYLRPFTYNGSHLCVYQKASDIFSPKVSIKNIGSLEGFYTLSASLVGDGHERDLEVGFLQKKDAQFKGLRVELECLVSAGDEIEPDLRRNLSSYLSLQMVRTPVYRNFIAAFMEDHLARGEYEPPPPPYAKDGRLSRDILAFIQARDLKSDLPQNLAMYLGSLPWQLAENRTQVQFYTSDSPVVWHQYGPQVSGTGRVEGDGVFVFPVTPTLALMAWWGPSFDSFGACSSMRLMSETEVEFCNHLQIAQSHLHIFSQCDHSHTCRRFCSAHPEVRDPEHHKREAVVIANSDMAREIQAQVREQIKEQLL